jgi:hypothetical protein
MPAIDGKTVAFLATDGVEQAELDQPWQARSSTATGWSPATGPMTWTAVR